MKLVGDPEGIEALKAIKKDYSNVVFETEEIKASNIGGELFVTLGDRYRVFADVYHGSMIYQEERNYHRNFRKLAVIYHRARSLFQKVFPISIDEPISFVGVDPVDEMIGEEDKYAQR